MFVIHKVA